MSNPKFLVTFKLEDNGHHLNSFEDYKEMISNIVKKELSFGGLIISEIEIKEIKE